MHIAVRCLFLVQKSQLPFPQIDRSTGVRNVSRGRSRKPRSVGTRRTVKAVEFLAVDMKAEA
jgi:hypothetical protein